MDFDAAREQFLAIIDRLDAANAKEFVDWIKNSFTSENKNESTEADLVMSEISRDLKSMVPFNAILSTEKILNTEPGPVDYNPTTTLHIDAFLYDDDDVDKMCEQGVLSRSYCLDCGSHRTSPLTFISHSMSLPVLKFIFQYLLPPLIGKTVLDIGSRLGNVLYAAHQYNVPSRIVGIEYNTDWCQLQETMLEKYSMRDKASVICADVRAAGVVIAEADVIVFHNVFQAFVTAKDQNECWQVLRGNIKSGAVLITIPSLQELTGHLEPAISLTGWATAVPIEHLQKKFVLEQDIEPDSEVLSNIYVYQIN